MKKAGHLCRTRQDFAVRLTESGVYMGGEIMRSRSARSVSITAEHDQTEVSGGQAGDIPQISHPVQTESV